MLLTGFLMVRGQLPDPVAQDIVRSYMPWQNVEFSGKLSCDRLPVSPSVKIYMERDSLVQVSVRVPLLGEVGRLTLTPEELTVVNKMKKVYVNEETARLRELYPSVMQDLQAMLLARVVVLGQGELGSDNMATVEVQPLESGDYALVPQVDQGVIPFNYGYVVGSGSRTLAMLANVASKGSLEILYGYDGGAMSMDITLTSLKKKKTEIKLDFSSVKWGGRAMTPLKLAGYDKVGLKEFMSRLKL